MKKFLFSVLAIAASITMFAQPQYSKVDMNLETRESKPFPQEFSMGNAVFVDYNNDGWLDIAIKGRGYWTNAVTGFLKNTNGTLSLDKTAETAFPINDYNGAFRTIDFNNDGNVDLLMTSEYLWKLWKNNGNGTFAEVSSFQSHSSNLLKTSAEKFYTHFLQVADMNNDGNQDIITYNSNASKVLVLEGDGAGNFTMKELPNAMGGLNGDGIPSSGICVGDVNNDGLKDVVMTGWSTGGTCVEVLANQGNSTYVRKTQSAIGSQNSMITLADLNNDHMLDYISSGESNDGTNWWVKDVAMCLNSGNPNNPFSADELITNSRLNKGAIEWIDFDGDGDIDMYYCGEWASEINTFANNGKGKLSQMSAGSLNAGARGGAMLTAADYNKDGYPDLLAMGYSDQGGGFFKVWKNSCTGTGLTKSNLLAAPTEPMAVNTKDGVKFSWKHVYKAIAYNIYVKTTSGKIITAIPADPATGFVKVAEMTSGITTNFYTMNGLSTDDIAEWGVQSINGTKQGGTFAIGEINDTPYTESTLVFGEVENINDGHWEVVFNTGNKTLTYKYDGNVIVDGAFVRICNKPDQSTTNDILTSKDAQSVGFASESISDEFGSGTKYTYLYRCAGNVSLEQNIFIYKNYPYLITKASAVSNTADKVSYNYVAPIVSETSFTTVLPSGGNNRVYDMPFDNDNWHAYDCATWSNANSGNTSMEATALFDVDSRKGVVFGTIDHDTWKTGLKVTTSGSANVLAGLEIFSGCVNERTWDIIDGTDRYSMPRHGYVSGQRVSSSRVFVGLFDDWRDGLETYGQANNLVHPKRPWSGGPMFGWQSWGGMAQFVNYDGTVEVSDYFATNLSHFKNSQGNQVMVLDSYWDNMTDEQLKQFAEHCVANGQIPGIYDTPYTFWGGIDEADGWGTGVDSYTYGDIVLRAENGLPRKINGISIDPTHPVTKRMVKKKIERFKKLGFKYIKLDFLNNAALEAQSYYDPNVTTGMQAYNEGLRYYVECCGDDIFINLSIAPVWPAHYAQGRRVGCDAWGQLDQSQYTINCINLGWWLDRVYTYNDPDHLVYVKKSENSAGDGFDYTTSSILGAWSKGLNRIRTTTGIMCGHMLLGDNLSLNEGTCKGVQLARDRTEEMTSNEEILNIARLGKTFRPIEGSISNSFTINSSTEWCDNTFYLDSDDAWYVVVFNFGSLSKSYTLTFDRLGIDTNNVQSITELWNNASVTPSSTGFTTNKISSKDVHIYKIAKKSKFTTVSVGVYGYNTLCSDVALDFSNAQKIEAYRATTSGSTLTLTKAGKVAAGEGIILYCKEGATSEDMPHLSTMTETHPNDMVGVSEASVTIKPSDDEYKYFYLSVDSEGKNVGFYKPSLSGKLIPKGKAYLRTGITNEANSFRIIWGDDDGSTGINNIKEAPMSTDPYYYTLQGVRVEYPTKGLYIHRGKKILKK